jgi:hypothetical protein
MEQQTGELTVMQRLRLEIQNYCGDQIFKDIYQDLFDKAIQDDIEQIKDVYDRGKENAPLNLSLFFEVPDNK